jgi:hypothetical protein
LDFQANGWVQLWGRLEPRGGGPDTRSTAQRYGTALSAWGRLDSTGSAPTEGGERPQIVVTIGLDELTTGLVRDHHVREWRHGGETATENLAMLCAHHRTVHHTDWEST